MTFAAGQVLYCDTCRVGIRHGVACKYDTCFSVCYKHLACGSLGLGMKVKKVVPNYLKNGQGALQNGYQTQMMLLSDHGMKLDL